MIVVVTFENCYINVYSQRLSAVKLYTNNGRYNFNHWLNNKKKKWLGKIYAPNFYLELFIRLLVTN